MGGSLRDIDGLEIDGLKAVVLELVEKLSALEADPAARA